MWRQKFLKFQICQRKSSKGQIVGGLGSITLVNHGPLRQKLGHCLSDIKKCKEVIDIDCNETVFISPDRSSEERLSAARPLLGELKTKRQNDRTHRYFIRKGEIVGVKLIQSSFICRGFTVHLVNHSSLYIFFACFHDLRAQFTMPLRVLVAHL